MAATSASPIVLRLLGFPATLPSTRKTVRFRGKSNSSIISRKMPDFCPDNSLLVNGQETMHLTSPEKPMKNEIQSTSFLRRNWQAKQLDLVIDSTGGRLVHGGLVYRENISIRSFEIGINGKMSLSALVNHLQDTALNHARHVGLLADGFGSTSEMFRNDLIWVVSAMEIIVDSHPSWADAIQIDTWMYASGKNGLGRDWVIRHAKTGEILIQAASVCLIMNKKTRKLSRFTDEIREHIAPFLMNCNPITVKDNRKLLQLTPDTASHVRKGLMPGWTDMDVNRHVSHVKYIDWILEGVPLSFIKCHELSIMTLEYRRECDKDTQLQSLSKIVNNGANNSNTTMVEFEHLLCLEDGSHIVRGQTTWKPMCDNGTSRTV